MKRAAPLLLLLVAALLGGCATAKGFGKDVKHTGKAIERGSDKAKEKLESVMP